jgi:DNA-binding response OmpR family regulator
VSPRPGSLADRLSGETAVLVVEDEPDIAALLGAFFRASGLGLIHINPSSVDEVVAAITEHRPSCVLLDVMLVGLSGLDALATIRQTSSAQELPVFVVSADGRAATRDRAEELGAVFVAKPFSVSALFDDVAAAAAGTAPTTPDDVTGRLAEHLARAQDDGAPLSFALVRVGSEGAAVTRALRELPLDTVLGRGEDDEIAVILPGAGASEATNALVRGLAECGADVRAGVAASPTHASTADELYMAADAALADAVDTGQTVVSAR